MRIRFAPVLFALTLLGLASVPVHAVTVNFASPGLEAAVREAFEPDLVGPIDSTDLDVPTFSSWTRAAGASPTSAASNSVCS